MVVCELTDRFCYRSTDRGRTTTMTKHIGPLPPKMLPSGAPAYFSESKTPPTIPIQNVFKQYAIEKEKQEKIKQQEKLQQEKLKQQQKVFQVEHKTQSSQLPGVQNIYHQSPQFVQSIQQPMPVQNFSTEQFTNNFLCALASQSQPGSLIYNHEQPVVPVPCQMPSFMMPTNYSQRIVPVPFLPSSMVMGQNVNSTSMYHKPSNQSQIQWSPFLTPIQTDFGQSVPYQQFQNSNIHQQMNQNHDHMQNFEQQLPCLSQPSFVSFN